MPVYAVSLVLFASLAWPSFVVDERGPFAGRRPAPPDPTLRAPAIVDLSRIPREIRREPHYRTDRQGYLLLVFGRWAERRVWVVRDGGDLYVDLDADGDLTGPGERFAGRHDPRSNAYSWTLPHPHSPDVAFDHGHDPFTLSIDPKLDRASLSVFMADHPALPDCESHLRARVTMAGSPAEAEVLRFDGPLSMTALIQEAEDRPSTFTVRLLLESLGHGRSHYDPEYTLPVIKSMCADGEDIPGPLVTIRFPRRDGGEWTISERFDLRRTSGPGGAMRSLSLAVTPPAGLDPAGVARVSIAPQPGRQWLLGRPLVFTIPIAELAEFAEAPARNSELEFRRRPGSSTIDRRNTYRRGSW